MGAVSKSAQVKPWGSMPGIQSITRPLLKQNRDEFLCCWRQRSAEEIPLTLSASSVHPIAGAATDFGR